MGDNCHILGRHLRASGRRAAAILGLLVLLMPLALAADQEPRGERERPVSTSPLTSRSPQVASDEDPDGRVRDTPVLTRAAARQRVEEMSPVAWLARFGSVSVGRLE